MGFPGLMGPPGSEGPAGKPGPSGETGPPGAACSPSGQDQGASEPIEAVSCCGGGAGSVGCTKPCPSPCANPPCYFTDDSRYQPAMNLPCPGTRCNPFFPFKPYQSLPSLANLPPGYMVIDPSSGPAKTGFVDELTTKTPVCNGGKCE